MPTLKRVQPWVDVVHVGDTYRTVHPGARGGYPSYTPLQRAPYLAKAAEGQGWREDNPCFSLMQTTLKRHTPSRHNLNIDNPEVEEHRIPARDVLSSVEFQPEVDLVNLLGGSQDPQVGLREDEIVDAIERPHQERLQNSTVGVVLKFHYWIHEVGVEENGSTTSTQIYHIGKSFNHSHRTEVTCNILLRPFQSVQNRSHM